MAMGEAQDRYLAEIAEDCGGVLGPPARPAPVGRATCTWQRERDSVLVRRQGETQANEARPFDDDPLVDRAQMSTRGVDGGTVRAIGGES